MKITVFVDVHCAYGAFKKGSTTDKLPDEIAQGLLDAKKAELWKEKTLPIEDVIEITVAEIEVETTAKPAPKKRGRK